MDAFWQDLKFGARLLCRNPGFAVVALLTLAVGIGANAAIFSVVNGVLLHPLPFSDPDRVILVWETDLNRGVNRGTAALAEFLDWREQQHVFRELSAYRTLFFTLTGANEPEQIYGGQVSANFFHLLGVRPAFGRDFREEEEQPGNDQVALLSYGLWQRRYGGDRSVLGNPIDLNGKSYTVVGVMPRTFSLYGTYRDDGLWVPFGFHRAELDRDDHQIIVFGRLKDGVSLAQAQAEMEIILERLKREYPAVDQKVGVRIVRFKDDLVRGLGPGLIVVMIAVSLVLLIACANVANLMLARAVAREREMAVRSVVGAGMTRILRQVLTESALLGVIGGSLGILVAYGGLQFLRAELSTEGVYRGIGHPEWIGINGKVLLFTLGISLLTGVIFGLAPAVQISRLSLRDPLKEGGRGSTSGRRVRVVRSALIVSEIALSFMLLAGAGLLARSFLGMLSEDIGLNPSHLLTLQVVLPRWRYASGSQLRGFYQQLVDRAGALPGVKSASAVDYLPLTGWESYVNFDIAGRAHPPSGLEFTSQFRIVDQKYLSTMGIAIEQGRDFQPSDGPYTAGVAIVNQALAHRYWPHEDPVGKQIRLIVEPTSSPWYAEPNTSWLTIVGVAGDVRDWAWGDSKDAYLYVPYVQNPSPIMRLVVRTKGDPTALAAPLRQAVYSIDPDQPVTDVATMDEVVDRALSERRLSMLLLSLFAAVATLLAAVGIYGVIAFGVTQRTHEIGIRMALGAKPAKVMVMILRDGTKVAAVGFVLGALGSLLGMRLLQSQLYGIQASDPLTMGGVMVVLGLVAAAACYFPARRATKVDPLVALRYE